MRSLEEKGCYNYGQSQPVVTSNVSTGFEFSKRSVKHHGSQHQTGLGKPTPSKWDDAQKWLVGLSRGGERHHAIAQPRNSNADDRKLIAPVPRRENDYLDNDEVKMEENGFSSSRMNYDVETKKVDCAESVWRISKASGNSASAIRSICVRDMGTEMTPIASQEPSRTGTPIRATTPVAPSPISSGSSTPVIVSPTGPTVVGSRSANVTAGRGSGGSRLPARNGDECGYCNVPDSRTSEPPKPNPLENQAIAWDEAERAKYMARYKRKEIKIQSWENHEKRKAEMEMKSLEVKAERLKSRAQEKLANKLAATTRIAEEKRANAEAKLNKKAVRTWRKADHIRRTGFGKIPGMKALDCATRFRRNISRSSLCITVCDLMLNDLTRLVTPAAEPISKVTKTTVALMNLMESSAPADHMIRNQEEAYVYAKVITQMSIVTHSLRAAVELNIFDIIAKHDVPLSASQIAACFPKQDVIKTPALLDRMLYLFASFSLLSVTQKGGERGSDRVQRLYALSPAGKYFVKSNVEGSFATFLMFLTEPIEGDIWSYLKEAIMEGISPSEKALGLPIFQVMSQHPETGKLFNKAMSELSTGTMKKLLETYKGFNDINSLVDIGGGDGSSLKMVISMNPHITGINFDLPQVIAQKTTPASHVPGITHVGGDMFVLVPKGDAIMLKNVLHNWGDESCVQILKLCYEAIPNTGKVILIEAILPDALSGDQAKEACMRDVTMFIHPGGKERTRQQFINLSRDAGFSDALFITSYGTEWIIEFHK